MRKNREQREGWRDATEGARVLPLRPRPKAGADGGGAARTGQSLRTWEERGRKFFLFSLVLFGDEHGRIQRRMGHTPFFLLKKSVECLLKGTEELT